MGPEHLSGAASPARRRQAGDTQPNVRGCAGHFEGRSEECSARSLSSETESSGSRDSGIATPMATPGKRRKQPQPALGDRPVSAGLATRRARRCWHRARGSCPECPLARWPGAGAALRAVPWSLRGPGLGSGFLGGALRPASRPRAAGRDAGSAVPVAEAEAEADARSRSVSIVDEECGGTRALVLGACCVERTGLLQGVRRQVPPRLAKCPGGRAQAAVRSPSQGWDRDGAPLLPV